MTTSNEFTDYYKTISNAELLNILENPGDYQDSAIEAAKKELSDRQLSKMQEANEAVNHEKIKADKKKENVKAFEGKVKSSGDALFDTLNPIQAGAPSTEKSIRLIVIVFGGLFFTNSSKVPGCILHL